VKRGAVEEVASLKQQPGGNLLISGSMSLPRALMETDTIDECRLVLCGRPLSASTRRCL
jgi:hypothetical protein